VAKWRKENDMAERSGATALLDTYFEALGTGDPGLLPLADGARYTENGQDIPFGAGAWATVTSAGRQRAVTLADPEQGHQAAWGLVSEGGAEVLLAVRLKADAAGLISEAEAFAVRSPMFGRTDFPARLGEPSPQLGGLVEPASRASRAELVAAANAYFDGVQDDDADLIPAADDCLRIENGVLTVLNPSGEGHGAESPLAGEKLAMSIRDQVRLIGFPAIEKIRDRRYPVIDAERGLVLGLVLFDHPGPVRGSAFPARFAAPNSYMIWELFRVSGGLIRHIEAIMAMFPYGMRAGW
jgi:hypothetical protein